ncbi:hypothetical protein BACCOP_03382 [Phocaeicola coprocola DSM 17136]|uniref:Uncharacterized protein n=1 Tax=Phocaeicola coprocola DSM 17136 TaxID=470145 RepID=B3JN70_9BACT|nr:hypothetical protein BACCOP_03382 [Phocaeicola coprocola DSM 17136]
MLVIHIHLINKYLLLIVLKLKQLTGHILLLYQHLNKLLFDNQFDVNYLFDLLIQELINDNKY